MGLTYIALTLWSWGWQEIPVQLQGDSSESCQLLSMFLLSFKTLFISSSMRPGAKRYITKWSNKRSNIQNPKFETWKKHRKVYLSTLKIQSLYVKHQNQKPSSTKCNYDYCKITCHHQQMKKKKALTQNEQKKWIGDLVYHLGWEQENNESKQLLLQWLRGPKTEHPSSFSWKWAVSELGLFFTEQWEWKCSSLKNDGNSGLEWSWSCDGGGVLLPW